MDNNSSLSKNGLTPTANVDARIISLHSRGPRADRGLLRLSDPTQYYTFNYYDAISVQAVNISDAPPLLSAYQATLNSKPAESSTFSQVLLAFTDIGGDGGYLQEELDSFWADSSKPLFFMSMIHIKADAAPKDLLERLKTIPLSGRSFTYCTFDHSDFLVFYKGNCFQEYARYIMSVTYSLPKLLTDSITLYSFSDLPGPYNQENCQEKFGAYLKIGISDYEKWDAFRKEFLDSQVFECWLLGRNDVALFNPAADLNWLRGIWTRAVEDKDPWYTTYDLSVLISPDDAAILEGLRSFDKKAGVIGHSVDGESSAKRLRPADGSNKTRLQSYLDDAYCRFKAVYIKKCKELDADIDAVWLRWLSEAYVTAESLLESALASDLGICLIPQFIDFFEFSIPIFECSDLTLADIEKTKTAFSTFFANISSLIDSMNHSSRQFVQVPSFQSASFEMPPKIMAYYVALGQQLIPLLQDDTAIYGFTISPSFVETLSVYSLGLQTGRSLYNTEADSAADEQPKKRDIQDNEFLSVAVDEQALYTLDRTIETLAHEFSHFLGGSNRCRPVRKDCILRGVLEEFLVNFLGFFSDTLQMECPVPGQKVVLPEPLNRGIIKKYAALLLNGMTEVESYHCGTEEAHMMDDVQYLISRLCDFITGNRDLCSIIYEFIYTYLFDTPDSAYRKYLLTNLRAELPVGNLPESSMEELKSKLIMDKVYRTAKRALDQYFQHPGKYKCSITDLEQAGSMCYLYRETFADLQAILLLNMDWSSYDKLLNDSLAQDIAIRKLAVSKALVKAGHWTPEEISSSGDGPTSHLISCNPDNFDHGKKFSDEEINVQLLSYLTKYLICCADKTIESFSKPEKIDQIEMLRSTYGIVSHLNTMLDIESELISEIQHFRCLLETCAKYKESCQA